MSASLAEIGRALRTARQQRGWTQQFAASRSGVGVRLWCEVESGKRAHVSATTLLAMLAAVGIEMSFAVPAAAEREAGP